MSILSKSKRLPKELSLLNVYAIATGATLSSGFFLLPGLAASQAGSAITLAYLLAALLLVPAMLSKAELCTAMPRAGDVYFFLYRSMGPLMGTIGGLGALIALILKAAFALIGMGAYRNRIGGIRSGATGTLQRSGKSAMSKQTKSKMSSKSAKSGIRSKLSNPTQSQNSGEKQWTRNPR